jgi:hypothetical protein
MSSPHQRNLDRRVRRGLLDTGSLRVALIVGSLVDLIVGAGMMFWPTQFLELSSMPEVLRDAPDFWPRYVAIFLFVLPWFYLLPALDLARYRGNVAGAVYGRSLGFVFYAMCFALGGGGRVFVVLGVVNLLFAVYYGLALGRIPAPTSITV